MVIVPPGGFAGYAQMTPASRGAWGTKKGNGATRRRRKVKSKAARAPRARKARKLKFGTPAWRKKYMKK